VQTYTPHNSPAMAAAIARWVPNPTIAVEIENRIQQIFRENGYECAMWKFVTDGDEVGYFAPMDRAEAIAWSSPNGYSGTTDTDSFGVAVTTLLLNHKLWQTYEEGDEATAREFDVLWRALDEWKFDQQFVELDMPSIISFLD